MIFGTLASAAAGFGTAFATSFGTMIPFRVLAGIGSSASMVGTNAFMSDVTSVARNHRAKLLGFQQTISGLAFVAGPALGGIMAEAYGARTAFYVVGVSAALCSFGYSFLPETVTNPRQIALFKRRTGGSAPQTAVEQPPIVPTAAATPTISTVVDNPKVLPPVTTPDTPPASPPEEPAAATTTTATVGDLDAAATAKPAEMTWRQLLSDPTQQSLLVVVAAMCVCYSAQIAVLPLHLASVFHMSVGDIGLVFSIASGLSVCGAAVGGWAADRFGRKVVIVSSSMLAAVSACLLTLPATPVHFTFVMVVWSLALSLLNPALSALAADIAPNAHRGKTMALSRQASDVMFAIGPIALGALSQAVNSQAALVTTGALVAAAALHFVVRAKPPSLHTRISAKPTKAQVDKDDTKDS
jgi:MFS family permease